VRHLARRKRQNTQKRNGRGEDVQTRMANFAKELSPKTLGRKKTHRIPKLAAKGPKAPKQPGVVKRRHVRPPWKKKAKRGPKQTQNHRRKKA